MNARCLALLLAAVTVNACASGQTKDDRECRRYAFAGGASVDIRSDFAGTASAILELGRPRDIMSLAVVIPDVDEAKLPLGFVSASLSALFRPLRSAGPECDPADGTHAVHCYKELAIRGERMLQLRVVIDVAKDTSIDPEAATNRVAAYLEKAAFACGGGDAPTDIALPKENALSDVEVRQLATAAVNGDSKAASRLSEYFADGNNLTESNFWLQLAAEQGDCAATKNFLQRTRHMNSLNRPERIAYWSKRAIETCGK